MPWALQPLGLRRLRDKTGFVEPLLSAGATPQPTGSPATEGGLTLTLQGTINGMELLLIILIVLLLFGGGGVFYRGRRGRRL